MEGIQAFIPVISLGIAAGAVYVLYLTEAYWEVLARLLGY